MVSSPWMLPLLVNSWCYQPISQTRLAWFLNRCFKPLTRHGLEVKLRGSTLGCRKLHFHSWNSLPRSSLSNLSFHLTLELVFIWMENRTRWPPEVPPSLSYPIILWFICSCGHSGRITLPCCRECYIHFCRHKELCFSKGSVLVLQTFLWSACVCLLG